MGTERFIANERMADKVAGALLLPQHELELLRGLDTITLQSVRDVATRQQISLSVVVNRLRFGDPRPSILLSLRRGRHGWETDRVVGGVAGLTGHIHVLPDQFDTLDGLPRNDVELTLRARVGRGLHLMRGTGNLHGSSVLVLINHVSTKQGSW